VSGSGSHGSDSPDSRPIRAVLFDLDGTLIDTVGLILTSMRHATREILGREFSDEELMCGVGTPLAAQMEILGPEHADELVTEYRRHNWDVHDDLIAEYPGTEEVLEELTAMDLPLGVVTSKSRRVAMRGIELFGLERFFEVIVCSDDLDKHKPDPEPILHAAEIVGVAAHECAYVGDRPYDMSAAVAAESIGVAALWGAFCAQDVLAPGPDYAISSIQEVLELFGPDRNVYRVGRSGDPLPETREAPCPEERRSSLL